MIFERSPIGIEILRKTKQLITIKIDANKIINKKNLNNLQTLLWISIFQIIMWQLVIAFIQLWRELLRSCAYRVQNTLTWELTTTDVIRRLLVRWNIKRDAAMMNYQKLFKKTILIF